MAKRTVSDRRQSTGGTKPETPALAAGARDTVAAGVAVVIPAYNEAATIRDIASAALAQAKLVIVVDDGSADGTAGALADLPVTLLQNPRNMGKGASLKRGIDFALLQGAAAVITLDGDGQHRPEDIPRLIDTAARRPGDVIIGSRLGEKEAFPGERYYANRVANFWISWAAGYPIEDSQSGFRCYPAALLKQPRISRIKARRFDFESEVLIEAARLGYRSTAIAIPAIYGTQGRDSHFRPVYDILLIARMVAWKLISRGFYPSGFYHAFIRPAG